MPHEEQGFQCDFSTLPGTQYQPRLHMRDDKVPKSSQRIVEPCMSHLLFTKTSTVEDASGQGMLPPPNATDMSQFQSSYCRINISVLSLVGL